MIVGPNAHLLEPLMLQWLKLHAMHEFANDVYWYETLTLNPGPRP